MRHFMPLPLTPEIGNKNASRRATDTEAISFSFDFPGFVGITPLLLFRHFSEREALIRAINISDSLQSCRQLPQCYFHELMTALDRLILRVFYSHYVGMILYILRHDDNRQCSIRLDICNGLGRAYCREFLPKLEYIISAAQAHFSQRRHGFTRASTQKLRIDH